MLIIETVHLNSTTSFHSELFYIMFRFLGSIIGIDLLNLRRNQRVGPMSNFLGDLQCFLSLQFSRKSSMVFMTAVVGSERVMEEDRQYTKTVYCTCIHGYGSLFSLADSIRVFLTPSPRAREKFGGGRGGCPPPSPAQKKKKL